MIKLIVAVDANYGIGKNNDLLFRSYKDLENFKQLTSGNTVVMGRNTWESLPENRRPLPNRRNVVITRHKDYTVNDSSVFVEHDFVRSLKLYNESGVQDKDLWIIGGATIYKQALPYADEVYMTVRHDSVKGADVFFPYLAMLAEGYKLDVNSIVTFEEDGVMYSFKTYRRVKYEN